MKFKSCLIFFVGVLVGVVSLSAQGRRPPLPHEPLTTIIDSKIRTDLEIIVIENIPCLSLKNIKRIFGGQHKWKRISREVIYKLYRDDLIFPLNAEEVVVDGKTIPLKTPVRWMSGQLYVPMDFLSTKAFQDFSHTTVQWDPPARMLTVESVPDIASPRYFSYAERSRILVNIGPRVHHRVMGRRDGVLTVRLFGGRSKNPETIEMNDRFVKKVTLRPKRRSTALLVHFMPKAGFPRVTLQEKPRALVIDVGEKAALPEKPGAPLPVVVKKPTTPKKATVPVIKKSPKTPKIVAPPVVKRTPAMIMSPVKTVVIDAGHGGKDPGAIGPHGTKEKDINLKIAKALEKVLRKEGRYKVIMTRDTDEFITLQKRADIANKAKADLFVSIHCNSALSHKSHGFEVYFMSEKATDKAAAAVARRENAVVELEGVSGKAKMKLKTLLWSLAKTETLNESSEIAALMASQVKKRVANVTSRGVKQAGFFVLKGATMPAVLVESGFLSHKKEEGVLRSSRYHRKLADALYAAIVEYEKRKVREKMKKKSVESG